MLFKGRRFRFFGDTFKAIMDTASCVFHKVFPRDPALHERPMYPVGLYCWDP